jgi:hypothetical protein
MFLGKSGGEVVVKEVEADVVAKAVSAAGIPVAILNACESARDINGHGNLAKIFISHGLSIVLAMSFQVSVKTAVTFMSHFYSALMISGQMFQTALFSARDQLRRDRVRPARFDREVEMDDWIIPVVYKSAVFELSTFEPSRLQRRAPIVPVTSVPQVFGRDLDILRIELQLLEKKSTNIMLLRGMAGIGKTTLLQYLSDWWKETGFIEDAIVVDCREGLKRADEVCRRIDAVLHSRNNTASEDLEVRLHGTQSLTCNRNE